MYKKNTTSGFNPQVHLHILKILFIFINVLILLMYGFMLALFNDFPFDVRREANFVLIMLGTGTAISLAVSFVFMLGDALYCLMHKRKQMHQPALHNYNDLGSIHASQTELSI